MLVLVIKVGWFKLRKSKEDLKLSRDIPRLDFAIQLQVICNVFSPTNLIWYEKDNIQRGGQAYL